MACEPVDPIICAFEITFGQHDVRGSGFLDVRGSDVRGPFLDVRGSDVRGPFLDVWGSFEPILEFGRSGFLTFGVRGPFLDVRGSFEPILVFGHSGF